MRLLQLLLAGLALASSAPAALAHDAERAAERERFDALSPDQQIAVRERFARFRALSDDDRAAAVERHGALARVRDQVLETLPEGEASRILALPPKERRAALKPYVKDFLRGARESLVGSGSAAGAAAPPPAPRAFQELRAAAKAMARDRLLEMEQDGRLQPGEAAELLALSPGELGLRLREIHKRWILEHPPQAFLRLSPAEQERLSLLPGPAFLEELRALGPAPAHAPDSGPLLEQWLGKKARGEQGDRALFEGFLTPEQRLRVEPLQGFPRKRMVMDCLRDNARAELLRRGEDPKRLQKVLRLPPGIREHALLRVLDPSHVPPQPPVGPPPRGARR